MLHILFATLHALGKTIENSGLDMSLIESGIYTCAAMRKIHLGKKYKRGLEYHLVVSLAVMMLKFDSLLDETNTLVDQVESLLNALESESSNITDIYIAIKSWYDDIFMKLDDTTRTVGLSKFLDEYVHQVNTMFCLVEFSRTSDFEMFLMALEHQIKYFFSRDLLNYARLMPIYLGQMRALEEDDPETWKALKEGDFVVSKSSVPFVNVFTDQGLEQEIKTLKGSGGIVGITQDAESLDRKLTISPYLCRQVTGYLSNLPRHTSKVTNKKHYQLSGNMASRLQNNALKLKTSLENHCDGNPYKVETPLKNIASSAVVPDNMHHDVSNYADLGQKRFEQFVEERLLPESTVSVWDPMKQLKLHSFSNLCEKKTLKFQGAIVKLREERQLLSRCLVIQKFRPDLTPKLDDIIGNFEMAVIPRSLFRCYESLHIPEDKSAFVHCIEKQLDIYYSCITAQSQQENTVPTPLVVEGNYKVLIIDAMAEVQSLKKTPDMQTIQDLVNAFIARIQYKAEHYNELRVVFDRYLENSLKNKTRAKRATTGVYFDINFNSKFIMSLKDLLSSWKTKSRLSEMLAVSLVSYFANSPVELIVAYSDKILIKDISITHNHEEADTLIPNQLLSACAARPSCAVDIWSPDTDVLLLLMDLVSNDLISESSTVRFRNHHRSLNVRDCVTAVGKKKSQGLVGLHNFSGADWGGKLSGKTKKTWINKYVDLNEDDPIIGSFRELGTIQLPQSTDCTQYSNQVKL